MPQQQKSMKHMKVSVRVRGEWFAVPCSSPTKLTVRWLGGEALKRYEKLRPAASYVPGKSELVKEIRKTKGGAILDPDDVVINVLDNNDFVSVGESVLMYPVSDVISVKCAEA